MRQLARLEGPPFSVRRWLREGRGSLWMPYQAQQIPALRGLVSCWMGLAISETLALDDSEARRVWFHIDELDALGRIQNLKDAQTRVRKKGGCVVMGFQSIAQVRAVYGDAEAHTIVENCDNKLILRCGASENGGTARFASELIGEREVAREETTTSRTNGGRSSSSSTSLSIRRQVEKAVLPSEITRLADCTGYLKLATRPDWMAVGFKPIAFPVRVDAAVPIALPLRDAAD
jgi:type IV secretory pathway TraG/TraD family ATPase VirD4